MQFPLVRPAVAAAAVAVLLAGLGAVPAGAVSLSTPSGMKTVWNTPELSWSTADTEIADQVRVSKSAAVDASGMLRTRYTSLAGDAITTEGLTGGSTKEWADSPAAPLWPGTYFWQVQTTTTNADGTVTKAWSEVRKVVVKLLFGGVALNESLLDVSGTTATTNTTMKIRTNAKSVPVNLTFRLNGNVYATVRKPFTRADDIRQLVGTVQVRMVLKESFFRRGANVDSITGTVGSKATTGKVFPVKRVSRFTL